MSYVFSKALTERDADERLKKQLPVMNDIQPPISSKPEQGADEMLNNEVPVTNNIKPPLPVKPGTIKTSQPPAVKRKPLAKSQSVDTYSTSKHEIDLTQVGDSEWKDFVLKRKLERESEEAEDERIATIKSLNLHRQSLTGVVEETIVEDQVLNTFPSNQTENIKDPSMPTVVDTEWKTSETPKDNDVFPKEPDTKLPDLKKQNASDILDGECKKVTESNETNGVDLKSKELNTENNAVNTSPVAVMLPKPRQIGSELKRKSYAKNRSMSLPAIQLTPQIKRGSDMLKEAANAKTPYFCRLSRGSIDLQDTLGLSGLSLKEVPGSESNDKPET